MQVYFRAFGSKSGHDVSCSGADFKLKWNTWTKRPFWVDVEGHSLEEIENLGNDSNFSFLHTKILEARSKDNVLNLCYLDLLVLEHTIISAHKRSFQDDVMFHGFLDSVHQRMQLLTKEEDLPAGWIACAILDILREQKK